MKYRKEELARLHATLLDILAEIVRVCDECGIAYFIQGGSAIGAHFNQGIVPWDDDIDVGMTRPDYERFLREAPSHLRPQYFLEWFGTEPNTPFYFAKVKLNGTLFVEEPFRRMDIHHGIFVDIFPYDRIPDNALAERWHRFRSRFWINCFIGKAVWVWRWCGRCDIDKPLAKSFLGVLAVRCVCATLSRERIYRRMCRVLGAYNDRDCSRVNIVRMPKDQIPRDDIENSLLMPFGGMEVRAPRNIEAYLRHHYPNLRPVLPEEEQINHAPYRLRFGDEPMRKILSIIVPTYNMESLLGGCIDSLVGAVTADEVEVIVVNDGSSDGSLLVARDYEKRYPDTVRVIDKANGNYGSTINAALPVARGEYVRILDADDRFDESLLCDYVAMLRRHSGVDMVVSPFVEVRRHSARRVDYDIYSRRLYDYDCRYDADRIFADGHIRFFMMHSVAYRTALLRETGYRQSEGISYTDREWVFYPLFYVGSILFADIPLYRYNLAREGQTMSPQVQLRSVGQLTQLAENMVRKFAVASLPDASPERLRWLRENVADRMRIVLRKYLLEMDDDAFDGEEFGRLLTSLRRVGASCGIEHIEVPVNNILRVDLLSRWERKGRYPLPLRWLLLNADRLMAYLHAALFRRL